MGAALALIAAGKDGEAQRLLAELGGGGAVAPADATAALRGSRPSQPQKQKGGASS